MFDEATSFNQPLEKWDVSQVPKRKLNTPNNLGEAPLTQQVPKRKLNTPNNSGEESLTQQRPLSQKAIFIKNLDKKTTLERFAKDWHLTAKKKSKKLGRN